MSFSLNLQFSLFSDPSSYLQKDSRQIDQVRGYLNKENYYTGSRKTLRSTGEDYVFVNFADHGGPGMLGFPDDVLHVEDLTETLQTMHEGRK